MAIFLIALASIIALSNVNRLRLALESRRWPAVQGRVEEIATRDPEWTINGVGPSRWQDVLYRYSVAGKYFTATRKYFTGWSENWWRAINRSATTYESGTDVLVRYDPRNPNVAVLEPGIPLGLIADYVISLMLAVGGMSLWLAA